MATRRKKTSAGDSPSASASPVAEPSIPGDDRINDEDIRARAYELYLERAGENGNDVEDWLRAEKEYRKR